MWKMETYSTDMNLKEGNVNRRERESLNSTNNKQMKLTLCEQDKDSKQNISKVRVSEKVKMKGGGRRYQRK